MIELIFVIVILGILAAVAVPRMNNMASDARLANANESYCVNMKPMLLPFAARNNGSVVGFDITTIYPNADIVAAGFAYDNAGVLDAGNTIAVDGDNAEVIANTAILSDATNNVYVHILNGDATRNYRCFVSDTAFIDNAVVDAARDADALRDLQTNYLN